MYYFEFTCFGLVDLPRARACRNRQNANRKILAHSGARTHNLEICSAVLYRLYQTIGIMFCRVLHVESKHMTCATICYLSNLDIFQHVTQNSTCARQNTLYFTILGLIPMHILVSEVHVCIKVTLIVQLS